MPNWEAEIWERLAAKTISEHWGLQLRQGRMLTRNDVDSATQVADINHALAAKYFGKVDPVGKRIKFIGFDRIPDEPHSGLLLQSSKISRTSLYIQCVSARKAGEAGPAAPNRDLRLRLDSASPTSRPPVTVPHAKERGRAAPFLFKD